MIRFLSNERGRLGGGALGAVFAVLALTGGPALAAGEPGVARLDAVTGDVAITRGDSGGTVAGVVNAPVMVGDYLSTNPNSRAELQFDYGNLLGIGHNTQLRLTQLDPNAHRLQLAAGTVELSSVHRTNAHPEIDTPLVAVRPSEDGICRVTVTSAGTTLITVRSGQAEIVSQQGMQSLLPGGTLLVQGSPAAPQFERVAPVAYDGFDQWNSNRDNLFTNAVSYQYLNDGIVGGSDLSTYGRWVDNPTYGQVWTPNNVPNGWAPYENGQWTWEPYYGWTWVSSEPWGWAPYHYGNWFNQAGTGWEWYPGSTQTTPSWAPALVSFLGMTTGGVGDASMWAGSLLNSLSGNIGWVPLAPNEPLYPWWGNAAGYSSSMFGSLPYGYPGYGYSSPSYVTPTIVNNYYTYNYPRVTRIYRNVAVPGAVTVVSARNFVAGRFTRNVLIHFRGNQIRNIVIVRNVLPVVPSRRNLRFTNNEPVRIAALAPREALFRRFPAPSRPPSFEQQRAHLETFTRKLALSPRVVGKPPAQRLVVPLAHAKEMPPTGRVAPGRFGESSTAKRGPSTVKGESSIANGGSSTAKSGAHSAASLGTPRPKPASKTEPRSNAVVHDRVVHNRVETPKPAPAPHAFVDQRGGSEAPSRFELRSNGASEGRAFDTSREPREPRSENQPRFEARSNGASARAFDTPREPREPRLRSGAGREQVQVSHARPQAPPAAPHPRRDSDSKDRPQ